MVSDSGRVVQPKIRRAFSDETCRGFLMTVTRRESSRAVEQTTSEPHRGATSGLKIVGSALNMAPIWEALGLVCDRDRGKTPRQRRGLQDGGVVGEIIGNLGVGRREVPPQASKWLRSTR
jgi:hypothetical protein